MQRVTGSVIKLPEHALAPTSGGDEETPVHIIGPFYSVQVSVNDPNGSVQTPNMSFSFPFQSAQRRIRAMMLSTNPPPVTKKQKAAKEQQQQQAAQSSSGSGSQQQQQQQQQPSQQQQQQPQQGASTNQ